MTYYNRKRYIEINNYVVYPTRKVNKYRNECQDSRHLDTIMLTSLDAALAGSSPTDVASNIASLAREVKMNIIN